jgi:putative DNA primase/helicase
LHEATGLTVIVALDAGNLLTVARTIRMLAPNAEIVVCGDNDLSGVGQEAAEKAALAVGGRCEIPATTGHDWNDAINAGVDLCQI